MDISTLLRDVFVMVCLLLQIARKIPVIPPVLL